MKKVKVKWSRYRPGVAQRVGRCIALLFHDSVTTRGDWSLARPGRTLPPGKKRYSIYRRLGGPQGRSGLAKNIVPTGIRSRTVQSVVSLYTDWATDLRLFDIIMLMYGYEKDKVNPWFDQKQWSEKWSSEEERRHVKSSSSCHIEER